MGRQWVVPEDQEFWFWSRCLVLDVLTEIGPVSILSDPGPVSMFCSGSGVLTCLVLVGLGAGLVESHDLPDQSARCPATVTVTRRFPGDALFVQLPGQRCDVTVPARCAAAVPRDQESSCRGSSPLPAAPGPDRCEDGPGRPRTNMAALDPVFNIIIYNKRII